MTDSNQRVAEWDACPSGTLRQIAEQMRAERVAKFRRNFSRAMFATVALTLVGIGIIAWQTVSPLPGSLACHEVATLMPDFVAGQLDPATAARVRTHLAHCAKCRRAFQRMYPDFDLQLACHPPAMAAPKNVALASRRQATRV